jgi:hypothetical protein
MGGTVVLIDQQGRHYKVMFANQLRKTQQPTRKIAYRTRGYTGGPVTRLMSPSDLGR